MNEKCLQCEISGTPSTVLVCGIDGIARSTDRRVNKRVMGDWIARARCPHLDLYNNTVVSYSRLCELTDAQVQETHGPWQRPFTCRFQRFLQHHEHSRQCCERDAAHGDQPSY